MSDTTMTTSERIVTLDVIRGVAVMGIFSVNVVGMAMIEIAYFNPPSHGFGSLADKIMHGANFLLIDGKMRALFSILFGASAMLVIERAVAAGRSAARTHFARMAALLLFGLAHFYFIWWGDILSEYALIGMVAFLFWKASTRTLLIWAAALLSLHAIPPAVSMTMDVVAQSTAAPDTSPAAVRECPPPARTPLPAARRARPRRRGPHHACRAGALCAGL